MIKIFLIDHITWDCSRAPDKFLQAVRPSFPGRIEFSEDLDLEIFPSDDSCLQQLVQGI